MPEKSELSQYSALSASLPSCTFDSSDSSSSDLEISVISFSKQADPYGRCLASRRKVADAKVDSEDSDDWHVCSRKQVPVDQREAQDSFFKVGSEPINSSALLVSSVSLAGPSTRTVSSRSVSTVPSIPTVTDPFDPAFDVDLHLTATQRQFYAKQTEKRRELFSHSFLDWKEDDGSRAAS